MRLLKPHLFFTAIFLYITFDIGKMSGIIHKVGDLYIDFPYKGLARKFGLFFSLDNQLLKSQYLRISWPKAFSEKYDVHYSKLLSDCITDFREDQNIPVKNAGISTVDGLNYHYYQFDEVLKAHVKYSLFLEFEKAITQEISGGT